MGANQGAVLENEVADIASTHRRVQAQDLSPSELVRTCLERIGQLNPRLNAFITILVDDALDQA
ncbi:MAG: hypothetical protein ACJ77J_03765, partial [Gemmatimonadaceae bacterium]